MSTQQRRQVRVATWIVAIVLLICGVFGPSVTFLVLVAAVGFLDIMRIGLR